MATNPISPWLERLKRRYSPSRTRIGDGHNQPLPGGEGRSRQFVVGRELCLFTLIDASKVPPKQRASMVALAVRRAAPFNDPEFGVAWLGDFAAVWYWSRSRIASLAGVDGMAGGSHVSYIPEALLVGEASPEDGVQLLLLAQGMEGRAWKNGRIVASRWWPAQPPLGEWQGFLRGAGLPSIGAPPSAVATQIAEHGWASAQANAPRLNFASFDAAIPRLLLGTAFVAAMVMCFEFGAIARGLYETYQAKEGAASLDEPLKRILAAREQVDQNQARIAELLALRAPHSQMALMAEVARVMPGTEWQLMQWQQPAIGRVDVTVNAASADLEAIVTAWEQSPMFEDVTTETSTRRGEVTIKAKVSARQQEAQ